ncbi:glycosyltransferase [Emticicia sp. 17c]|uniref:glycosyltransferase n=1 Tax=Emticicia sp. 17c TaxID=3127704 RepID=UPI00301CF941
MSKKIAYVGDFRFPKGAASSIRVLGIGRILADCGYDVSFHGVVSDIEQSGQASGMFENFYYSNLVLKSGDIMATLYDLVSGGFRSIKLFESLKPDYIILGGGYSRYLIPLLRYTRKHNIRLIVDIWEWYDYSHLPGGKFGPLALDTHLALTKLIKKSDGVITISSFLERYYSNANKKVIRIPILINKEESNNQTQPKKTFDPNYLHLIYAGDPGRKDIIDVVIAGLDSLINEGIKVKVHLVGPSKQSLTKILGDKGYLLDKLQDAIVLHGKVAQDKVPDLLASADFSFLIRPDMRYAHAGFPTKFVESMNAGLPIICNLTSDLGMYVKNGENGFIMADTSAESFIACVKKASQLSEDEKKQMRVHARNVAEQSFDYRIFIEPVKTFFLSL